MKGLSLHIPLLLMEPLNIGKNESIFLEDVGVDIWDVVEDEPYVPFTLIESDAKKVKPKDEWNEDDKKKVQCNGHAKNIIIFALSRDEFFRLSNYETTKEIWDTLRVTHEGTNDVKRARMTTLKHMNTNCSD